MAKRRLDFCIILISHLANLHYKIQDFILLFSSFVFRLSRLTLDFELKSKAFQRAGIFAEKNIVDTKEFFLLFFLKIEASKLPFFPICDK